jgi:hypothetical protein
VASGYIIGRAVPPGPGPGPWWHYIETLPTFEAATCAAHEYAKQRGMRAWLNRRGLDYEPLPATDPDCRPWTAAGVVALIAPILSQCTTWL